MRAFFALVFLFNLSTFASDLATMASPDQDPLVKDMQSRFKSAGLPEAAQLIDKKFHCTLRSAFNFDQTTYDISFKENEDYIKVTINGGSYTNWYMDWAKGELLVKSDKEYVTSSNCFSGSCYASIRFVANTSALLIEETATYSELSTKPISTSPPENMHVSSYSICKLDSM